MLWCIDIFLGLLKHGWLGPTSRETLDPVGRGWGLIICISNNPQVMLMLLAVTVDFENHIFFSTSYLLRVVFSHAIWGVSALKIESRRTALFQLVNAGSRVDIHPHVLPGWWWLWAGSEGSRPGWERLGKSAHSQGRHELLDWGHSVELQSRSAFSCFSSSPIQSPLLICGEINACKVLEKPMNVLTCHQVTPDIDWAYESDSQVCWSLEKIKCYEPHDLIFPSLLPANTRGGNWGNNRLKKLFGVLTRRTKYRRIVSL